MAKVFDAASINLGFCARAECRAVHIQLLDRDDVIGAQAVIAVENIDAVCADLQKLKAHVLGAASSSKAVN